MFDSFCASAKGLFNTSASDLFIYSTIECTPKYVRFYIRPWLTTPLVLSVKL